MLRVLSRVEEVFASSVLPGFKLHTNWLWPAEKFIPVQKALQAMGDS